VQAAASSTNSAIAPATEAIVDQPVALSIEGAHIIDLPPIPKRTFENDFATSPSKAKTSKYLSALHYSLVTQPSTVWKVGNSCAHFVIASDLVASKPHQGALMRSDLSPEILAIINNTVSIRSPLESLIYLLVISYSPRTVPHIRQSQTTEDLAQYFVLVLPSLALARNLLMNVAVRLSAVVM
jgi:hypothetical protein